MNTPVDINADLELLGFRSTRRCASDSNHPLLGVGDPYLKVAFGLCPTCLSSVIEEHFLAVSKKTYGEIMAKVTKDVE